MSIDDDDFGCFKTLFLFFCRLGSLLSSFDDDDFILDVSRIKTLFSSFARGRFFLDKRTCGHMPNARLVSFFTCCVSCRRSRTKLSSAQKITRPWKLMNIHVWGCPRASAVWSSHDGFYVTWCASKWRRLQFRGDTVFFYKPFWAECNRIDSGFGDLSVT